MMKRIDLRLGALLGALLVLGAVSLPHFVGAYAPRASAGTRSILELHTSPSENLERIDLETLRQAHTSIAMDAYSLTDKVIIAALKDAALRGVRVSVYLDNEQTADELRRPDLREELLDLAATRNVNVRVKRSRILQHTKGYVIDSRLLREGSANFSPSALKQQDNTLVLTNDTEALRSFEHSYEIEWDRPDNIPLSQFDHSVGSYRGRM